MTEVYARRLDSPLDSVLRLTDAAGRQIAFNDDYMDKGNGLDTHHADSRISIKLPADGTYFVHLGDVQQRGGPSYGYRLRVSAPQPDFALRVVPSSINVRPVAPVPITVYALRKDGFSGEISLALKDAPAGFVLSGARVPAGEDRVRLTLAAPPAPSEEPVRLFDRRARDGPGASDTPAGGSRRRHDAGIHLSPSRPFPGTDGRGNRTRAGTGDVPTPR